MGDQPQDWRAANPEFGGRPTLELAGGLHTLVRGSVTLFEALRMGDQPYDWRAAFTR